MQQSGSMIISFLRKKICSTANRANVKFFNKSKKKVKWKITYCSCYGQDDLEGFQFYQGRLFPADQ